MTEKQRRVSHESRLITRNLGDKGMDYRRLCGKVTIQSPHIQDREFEIKQSLFKLCRLGRLDELRELLSSGDVLEEHMAARDYNGRSLTLTAAREGHVESVQALLEHRADPNVPNNDGWTPLHFACRGAPKKKAHPAEWASIVEALLHAGALVDAHTSKGFVPLHYACASGHGAAVRLLVSHRRVARRGVAARRDAAAAGELPRPSRLPPAAARGRADRQACADHGRAQRG